jgi:hypothetical protein
MTKAETARVANATVRITGKGGQGVLIPGGFILTATHCIKWSGDGGMAMGDYFIENVVTKSGVRLPVGPLAADPVSDMAVLGELDYQEFGKDCDQFEKWREATPAVPLANRTPRRFRESLRVHILTHKNKWITGRIVRYSSAGGPPQSGCLCIEADDRIEGGTSGGPVVDSSGRLIGVVSHSGETAMGEKYVGTLPIAHLALPRWAWRICGDKP